MINKLQQFLINLDTIKLSRILTLFFILVHFQGLINRYPMIAIPTLIFATIGLIFPEARDKKFLWAGISTSFTIYIFLNWQLIDNHIYLWGYWLLANVLSLFSRTPDETLKFSAKFLLMSCMLFAVYQKVNPSYLSGDFFYYTLLTDQRFFFISNLIDYNMIELIKENNFLLMDMKSYSKAVIFSAGPHILNQIALFLTWYTIILEGIIFGLFALPRRIAHQWQHWFLFLFFTVYFILPIQGFAYTLMNMGITLVKKDDLLFKIIYIALIFYMFAFSETIVNYIFKIVDPTL